MKKPLVLSLALFVLCCCVRPPASSLAAQPAVLPQHDPQAYTNSIGMEFVRIPAGSFTRTFMATHETSNDQTRQSAFIISKAFYLGKYQVTQEQWAAVMGTNPSSDKGQTKPVETISWNDAHEFIKRLNAREGHQRYRLPTEAEWELAARGGTDAPLFFMKAPMTREEAADALEAYAWFGKNSGGASHPVGQKKPNPYGLHDMYGNVWEWVQDWYVELPTDREIKDYCASAEDALHVLRGGCWVCGVALFLSGNRNHGLADKRNSHIGFRVAFSMD